MTEEKWQEVCTMIQEKFEVEDHAEEDLDPGTSEYYVFTSPLGKIKLVRTLRPKLVDRKVHTAKRIGAASEEERIYSKDEQVSFVKAYMWNEDMNDWSDMDVNSFL